MANASGKTQSKDKFGAEFFVLRTPALPVEELLAWSACQNGGTDWAAKVALLRAHLRDLIERPEIVQSLFVASPSLQSGLEYWRKDPDSKKGLQAERALTRYFARMCARSTPFGLFSGCSVGRVANGDGPSSTELRLDARSSYRPNTRLDFDYLFALTRGLRRDPVIAAQLRYWPNTSLRRAGEVWHYLESRVAGSNRSYHLVKVEDDEVLSAVLERSKSGPTPAELVAHILAVTNDAEITQEDAEAYVQDLIGSDLLVSHLSPPVTGKPPLEDLIEQVRGLSGVEHIAAALERAREEMIALDRLGHGAPPERYHAIASSLVALPAKADVDKLFQVDLVKPTQNAMLSAAVVEEFHRAIELVCRMSQPADMEALRQFRDAFSARFDRARIPLLTALDEENGVPFGPAGSESSPLLRGLNLGGGGSAGRGTSLQGLLQQQFAGRRPGAGLELELDLNELPDGNNTMRALPDSFAVSATLIANGPGALQEGDFRIYFKGLVGPDGARLLGRFCHTDTDLERFVREHLRAEAAHNQDAVYAEIVYLPEGRIGNVLCRPVLREYELVYLGRSGAPEEYQIPVSDLLISVEGGRIRLHSQRLGKEIIPRLTNAHGFLNPKLASVYRLLCNLQHQGVSIPGFGWGQLDSLDFLPRVRCGRIVLSTARWRLNKKEIDEISNPERAARFEAVQKLRERRGLPRWILLEEADNTLPIDLDNPLLTDAFVHVLKRGQSAVVREMFPPPDRQCAAGPEGTFCHELNVPFLRMPADASQTNGQQPVRRSRMVRASDDRAERLLAPGSDWLYVKIYGGEGAIDDVLRTCVPSIMETAAGMFSRWFFIRYSDPHHHLRIRFQGDPSRLTKDLLPLVTERFQPYLLAGNLWKIQFDTYEREMERYGGQEGIVLAEEIFRADSDAVLSILQALDGDAGMDERWRIALLGIDALLGDCGMDMDAKLKTIENMRDSHFREFNVGVAGKKQLGDRYRNERKKLEALFDSAKPATEALSAAQQAFAKRSVVLRGTFERLQQVESSGELWSPIEELAFSYVHMHVNRLIRSAGRAHETVLYDFLFRIYDSQRARGRKKAESAAQVATT
jgi:thiopeptide-type bacteriocin biosynthesis protein